MTTRQAWTIMNDTVVKKEFEADFKGGSFMGVRINNRKLLHDTISECCGESALDISRASDSDLGKALSAFNLELDGFVVERIYQSSKVFENGGPFEDFLSMKPADIKKDGRLKKSGKLIKYQYDGENWALDEGFYDYIYVKAVVQNYGENLDLSGFDWFTDIMLGSNAFNSQAQAIALYKLIQQLDAFDVLKDKDAWIDFHYKHIQ